MTVQLAIAKYMKRDGYDNAYALVQAIKAANGKVSEATIYRLVRDGGKVDNVRADTLEALAKLFKVDVADLFVR